MTKIRKITLQFPSLRAFLAEYGERISADGMLLRSEAPPAAGSTVDIEVVVAEGMRLLRARGEALWSGTIGAGSGQKAAAVRFLELDEASRTLISRIVDQRRREGAQPFDLDDVPGPREARLRDLTVPAAVAESEPDEPARDSIFDLEERPATAAVDLFAPIGADEAALDTEAEKPARVRMPAPPVPLLADPDPGPFDLGPESPSGEEVAAAGLPLEPAPQPEGESERSDLSELFGGDDPEMAPAGGHTEAFPPSFVDEVEAELEATDSGDAPEDSHLLVDTGELEAHLGTTIEDSEPEAELPAEAPAAPAPGPSVEVEAEPEPEPMLETEAVPDAESGLEAEAVPDIEVEAASEIEAEDEPESTDEPESEAAPEPEAEPVTSLDAEPVPESVLEVARAFNAEHGPETVEIPILATQPAPPPPAVEESPQVAQPPSGEASAPIEPPPSVVDIPPPPVEMPPPPGEAQPVVEKPPPATPLDDNLLSIPEFGAASEPVEEPATPGAQEDLPSSAESLRGAASRSHHLGTWLLIALLVGALGVAGYFLMGLVQGDGAAPEPDPTVTAAAPTVPETSLEEAPAETVPVAGGEEAAEEPEAEPVVEEVEGAPPAAAAAEPAQPESAAPLAGLNRITWNETGSETVLALVGDGAIPRERIEVASIGGDQPRLVIKISGVERAFQPAVLEVGTSHVERVRTGLQAGGQLHVVVDLAGPGVSMGDLAARGSRVEVRLRAE